jgi:hypothetical protein
MGVFRGRWSCDLQRLGVLDFRGWVFGDGEAEGEGKFRGVGLFQDGDRLTERNGGGHAELVEVRAGEERVDLAVELDHGVRTLVFEAGAADTGAEDFRPKTMKERFAGPAGEMVHGELGFGKGFVGFNGIREEMAENGGFVGGQNEGDHKRVSSFEFRRPARRGQFRVGMKRRCEWFSFAEGRKGETVRNGRIAFLCRRKSVGLLLLL